MVLRNIFSLIILLTLTGCWYSPLQKVTLPDGREYLGEVISGTMVEINTIEGDKIIFDRRGRPSIFEDAAKLYAVDKVNNN